MYKFFVISLVSFSLIGNVLFAQEKDKSEDRKSEFFDRIYLGGNLGLRFGSQTIIDVSPLVGYKFTDKLSAGVGVVYQYYSYKYRDYSNDLVTFNTSIYGAKVFGRYFFLDNIFAHAEYEILNLEAYDLNRRMDVTNILVGGGVLQQIGGRFYLSMMGLWNVNQSAYSPYANPIIRGGIIFK